MKIINVRHLGLVLALLTLDACTFRPSPAATQNFPPQTAAPEPQTNRLTLRIPAADARFRYEGRFDFSNSNR